MSKILTLKLNCSYELNVEVEDDVITRSGEPFVFDDVAGYAEVSVDAKTVEEMLAYINRDNNILPISAKKVLTEELKDFVEELKISDSAFLEKKQERS